MVTLWMQHDHPEAAEVDYHAWIHEELQMTETQELCVLPSERR